MSAQSTYTYKARDADGTVVTGSLVADSPEDVGARLRSNGKFVLSVSQNAMRPTVSLDADQIQRNEAAKRVRREDVITFCQQLSVMLETGVPLSEALDVICGQNPSRDFRKVLEALREDLYAGEPFSSAMAKWPRVFPGMMLSLMKASEASGTMALMLGRIGDYLARERRTAKQIKGALTYPTFMIFCGLAVTVFLMAFVLPRFAQIYASRSASLPVPTRVLIAVSDFLNTQYMYYGPVLVVGLVVGALWLRSAGGRRAKDWLRLNVPAVRTMYGQLYISRTARTMSTLLSAGVNVLDIIDICRGVTNNVYYDKMWDAMAAGVHEGGQLSDAVLDAPFIPPSVASMIGAGERTGRLSEVMERIAEFSEEELERAVRQVTTFIEPVMILIMGVVIGGVAVALLLPIFGMSQVMAGG
jgi:type IV pilus assembly protein PilC